MPRIRKTGDGKVAGEGPAKALPRKRGVRDETKGKGAGSRPGLRVGRSVVNYARRGR